MCLIFTENIIAIYVEPRQFDLWDAKILNIKRLQKASFAFQIIISVTTFIGPHKSPYGLETTIVRVDDAGIHVVDFKHEKLN